MYEYNQGYVFEEIHFDGTTDVNRFITVTELNAVIKGYHGEQKAQYMASLLAEGPALNAYLLLSDEGKRNAESIKIALRREFGDSSSHGHAEMRFDGTMCVTAFITSVELNAHSRGYNNEQKAHYYASLLCEGAALDAYLRLSEEEKKDPEKIKYMLTCEFKSSSAAGGAGGAAIAAGDLSFDGTTDVRKFITVAEMHALKKGYTGEEKAKYFAGLLAEGPALYAYLRLSDDAKKDPEMIKAALVTEFEFVRKMALDKLTKRKMKEGESPPAYAHALLQLTKLAYSSLPQARQEAIAKDYFMMGLSEEMQAELKALPNYNSMPLAALAHAALRIQTAADGADGVNYLEAYDRREAKIYRASAPAPGPTCCGVNLSSCCGFIFLLLLAILFFFMMVIGILHFPHCPIQPWLPWFLIISGFAGLVWIMLFVATWDAKRRDAKDKKVKVFMCLVILVSLFIFAWNIMGSIWVFPIWPKYAGKIEDGRQCCHTDTYLCAFVYLIIYWIVFPCQPCGLFVKWRK